MSLSISLALSVAMFLPLSSLCLSFSFDYYLLLWFIILILELWNTLPQGFRQKTSVEQDCREGPLCRLLYLCLFFFALFLSSL